MYNATALLDMHARAHESLRRLMTHCGTLTTEELVTPISGFGFRTVRRQLEHTIGAELYWQIVLTRGYHEEATLPDVSTLAALEAFRSEVAAVTRAYLAGASADELNSMRTVVSDPGETRVVRPADVIVRVVTHIFNHQGQVLAMCRTLGKPNDNIDLDYPLDEVTPAAKA